MIRPAQSIRRVLYDHDGEDEPLIVHDILVDEIPAGSSDPKAIDGKARAAARRALLRSLDRQITQLLDGDIEEIRILRTDD